MLGRLRGPTRCTASRSTDASQMLFPRLRESCEAELQTGSIENPSMIRAANVSLPSPLLGRGEKGHGCAAFLKT